LRRLMKELETDSPRRSAILDAADRLFRHYGPGKTTISDIARAVGIGVGSVYLEFSSKDAIVGELASHRHQRVLAAMRVAAREGSFSERIARVLEARVDALYDLFEEGAHSCDLLICSNDSDRSAWARFQQEEAVLLASLLEQGARSGELAIFDLRPTAEHIQRAFATLTPPALFEQSRAEARKATRAMIGLLLNGLVVRHRPPHRVANADAHPPRRRPFGSR
jgi:AcrR family transcriptional regulator